MKIVVTGGSGLTGGFVVEHLAAHGYEVLSVDRVKPARPIVPYKFADFEDLGQVYGCLSGADAVIHLAALPRPTFDTSEVVFRTNVMATFNVLEAAATLGIRRVVYASSKSVYGYPFFYNRFAPQYIPIDEGHPQVPQDPYGLSKQVGEVLAEGFTRRANMSIVSLRLSWIQTPESFKEQLMSLWDDPAAGASNLWGYVDARDAAQAFRLALEAGIQGHEAFIIAAPNTFMKTPTVDLVRQFYPESRISESLEGNTALLSSAKATHVLGYQPQYRWEGYF